MLEDHLACHAPLFHSPGPSPLHHPRQGGIYAPSIFIGAALGSAFGQMAHLVGDPYGVALSEPQAYALVGAPPPDLSEQTRTCCSACWVLGRVPLVLSRPARGRCGLPFGLLRILGACKNMAGNGRQGAHRVSLHRLAAPSLAATVCGHSLHRAHPQAWAPL